MNILEYIKNNATTFADIQNAADVVASVVAKMQEQGYNVLTNSTKEPSYVDKGQFDQVNTQVGELNKQLEGLKKAAGGNEELQKKIDDLQKQNGDWETKYKNGMLENAIKVGALKAKAKDANDILVLIDKSKVKFKDDNTLEGLDEQLTSLKETKGYLFGESVKIDGTNPPGNDKTVAEKIATDFSAGLNG